jgi:pimeloyl-ACP methyl ester carboxylesterase
LPGLVLIHGGEHAGDCWDLTVEHLHRQVADLRVLAVDLPGRRAKPGDLTTLTIADWISSVVADVDDAGLAEVVVVGHSLAGLTAPGVVARLGQSRVREMVLIAAAVPRQGAAIVDTLRGPLAWYCRWGARRGKVTTLPVPIAWWLFGNAMTRDQRRFMLSRMYAESARVITEPVDRVGFPEDVPRTWILTRRDRAQRVSSQRRSIAALGGVHTVIELDAGHDVMISDPEKLAEILLARLRTPRAAR